MKYTAFVLLLAAPAVAQDAVDKTEAAVKAAVAAVAPSVVRIETTGGTDMVGVTAGQPRSGIRKGTGPTTGLIVSADGYVITSAFNFANNPSGISVSVPGRKDRFVAKKVATDLTRFLTLVKIEATGLPVPKATPKAELVVGRWCAAVGRTLGSDDTAPPSISVGIISATGRIWGKAVQTDAKVSPVNYGGPLVALDGTVQGVLVPASTTGEGETAGVEWYDSGIGFAVPLEDVFAILEKLKKGKDLRRGLLGITAKSDEKYTQPVVVATVSPDSAAAKAGIKPNDKIVALAGRPVPHFSAMMHLMGPKYEGDEIAAAVERDGKTIEFPKLTLSGAVSAFVNPYIGILPVRDDPELGVEVRFVYPNSPAAAAGIKAGDRVMKFGPMPRGDGPSPLIAFQGRAALATFLSFVPPGTDIRLEVKRKEGGKTETLTVKVAALPDVLPETLPTESTAGKALAKQKTVPGQPEPPPEEKKPEEKKADEKKEIETGLLKQQNATLGREYWVYVPTNYTPDVSHGVIVWLHPAGQGGKDSERMAEIWKDFAAAQHYILVGPKSQAPDGWVASETEGVMSDVKAVLERYTVDRNRVLAHGMGVGGQMAFYLGFNARDTIRGVAATGAPLGVAPKDNLPSQPVRFFVVAGEKDPLIKEIAAAKPALEEKRFPVLYRPIPDFGKEYMDQKTLIELCIWMDSLDLL